jgi:uncharacterized protein YkwD
LQSELYRAASKARLDKKGWEVGGRNLRVIRWSAGQIVLRDDRRAEDFDQPWASLPLDWQDDLLSRGKARSPENLIQLARVAHEQGRDAMAGRLLGEVAGDESVHAEAEKLLPGFVLTGEVFAPAGSDVEALDDLLKDLEKSFGRAGREASKKKAQAFRETLKKLQVMDAYAKERTVEILLRLRGDELTEAESFTGLQRDLEDVIEARATLERARDHALKLIEDKIVWPYPYGANDEQVKRDVKSRISAVRKAWADKTSLKGKTTRKPEVTFNRIAMLQASLDSLDSEGRWQEPLPQTYLDYVRALTGTVLTAQNFATNVTEMERISWNRTVLDDNTRIAEEFKKDKTAPDAQAWLQLTITNDYRDMMGRHRLKMNFKLYWAARLHSEYCVKQNKGQIAHVIPGEPRGETPQQRADYESYEGMVGENISYITGNTPLKAHNGWLESSGHHRNILDECWRTMGNGRNGPIWTQLFGDSDEGEANTVSDGGS